jgi:hypothetical protein
MRVPWRLVSRYLSADHSNAVRPITFELTISCTVALHEYMHPSTSTIDRLFVPPAYYK